VLFADEHHEKVKMGKGWVLCLTRACTRTCMHARARA
jgi:hypothetical protein